MIMNIVGFGQCKWQFGNKKNKREKRMMYFIMSNHRQRGCNDNNNQWWTTMYKESKNEIDVEWHVQALWSQNLTLIEQ